MRSIGLSLLLGAAVPQSASADTRKFPTPLPEEVLPNVAVLPGIWPKSWVLIHDLNFASILDGKLALVDTRSADRPLKGLVRAAQFANELVAPDRGEIYTAETFYGRLTRGKRTDAITIWDMKTLQPKGEIILPDGKRQLSVTYPNVFQFTNGGKWALVANFTPAQSVTVVDLHARKVLGEIDLPGCTQIYPSGERGFSSLCADGSVFSVTLDDKGQAASSSSVAKVQDIDRQPLFGTPAMVGRTAWFVSYYGMVQGIDLSGPVAKPLPGAFSVDKGDGAKADGGTPQWRPGGWQVIASDAKGLLYVLMSPNGKEGSHKDGGTEVWVVDPVKKARLSRIALKGQGLAIAVTREDAPQLIVARADGVVDVHDAATGAFVRTLGATVAANPIVITVP
ncbi:amine dehydrogenase [Sphingobium lactosutens]|mgnify:CR=1 FL=1|uniref:amine dehydrogenase large subunit n=1 Tax=Sphingobium lactosutens TaxID=522773 RepID=UPI0015BAC1CC|nr:amine dehydrogenase large subunit [Sphingobium lactosutens]NWK98962.1 amine dehydrogenase [Sphingobium lactosutens]